MVSVRRLCGKKLSKKIIQSTSARSLLEIAHRVSLSLFVIHSGNLERQVSEINYIFLVSKTSPDRFSVHIRKLSSSGGDRGTLGGFPIAG